MKMKKFDEYKDVSQHHIIKETHTFLSKVAPSNNNLVTDQEKRLEERAKYLSNQLKLYAEELSDNIGEKAKELFNEAKKEINGKIRFFVTVLGGIILLQTMFFAYAFNRFDKLTDKTNENDKNITIILNDLKDSKSEMQKLIEQNQKQFEEIIILLKEDNKKKAANKGS